MIDFNLISKTTSTATTIILFSICMIASSCSKENFTTEDYLIDGVWKLKSTEDFLYINDELDNTEILLSESDTITLTFNEDYIVAYQSSYFKENLIGNWELSEDETYLTTDLSLTLSASTGFGTIYYYPKSKIIEIDKERLILESMPITSFSTSSQTSTTKELTSYTQSTFIKN